jgi:hypothetical protein
VFIIIVVALLTILISVSMYQAVPARKSAENPDTLPCVPIFVGWGRFFGEVYPLSSDISGRRLRENRSVSRPTRNADDELLGLNDKKENEAT